MERSAVDAASLSQIDISESPQFVALPRAFDQYRRQARIWPASKFSTRLDTGLQRATSVSSSYTGPPISLPTVKRIGSSNSVASDQLSRLAKTSPPLRLTLVIGCHLLRSALGRQLQSELKTSVSCH